MSGLSTVRSWVVGLGWVWAGQETTEPTTESADKSKRRFRKS
jgi:hypothetical protein